MEEKQPGKATSRQLSEDGPRLSKRITPLCLSPKLLSAGKGVGLKEPRLRGTQVRDGQK